MAAGASGSSSEASSSESGSVADLQKDTAWAAFRARLESSGFFQGNIPSSSAYKGLLGQAMQSYKESRAFQLSSSRLAAPARLLAQVLQEPFSAEELAKVRKKQGNLVRIFGGGAFWTLKTVNQQVQAGVLEAQPEAEPELSTPHIQFSPRIGLGQGTTVLDP